MGMRLKPGLRLRSSVDTTEVIVVRAPSADVELACGGAPLVPVGAPSVPVGQAPPGATSLDASWAGGTLLGKRYAAETLGVELLCTKGGEGSLSLNGEALETKDPKPLPSSD